MLFSNNRNRYSASLKQRKKSSVYEKNAKPSGLRAFKTRFHLGHIVSYAAMAAVLSGYALPNSAFAADTSAAEQGPLSQLGATLAAKGLYFYASNFNELFSTVGGGLKHGTLGGGQTDFSTEVDLGKAAGIPNAAFRMSLDYQYGSLARMTGSHTGASLIPSGIQGPGIGDAGTLRLAELSYSQSFLNDRVWFLVGRSQSTWFFNIVPMLLQFESVNVDLGSPTMVFNTSGAGYGEANWGGLVRVRPTQSTYIKVGVYEDNRDNAYANYHGFPGTDWSFKGANGVLVPVQMGVSVTPVGLSGNYAIGGYYDSSYYGGAIYGNQQRRGRTGIYIHATQQIWAPETGSTRGVYLFGEAAWATSGVNIINNAFAGGVIDSGPFAARPNDSTGILFTSNSFGGTAEANIANEIKNENYSGWKARPEYAFEAEYSFNFGHGLSFRPFVQHIWNPDQIFVSNPNPNDRSATVVGANFGIVFNDLLGLPVFQSQGDFRP